MNRDGQFKAEYVKKMHQQVKENLEQRTHQYETQANKGKKESSSMLVIGFGFTSERNVFQPNGDQSSYHEEMVLLSLAQESIPYQSSIKF
ncbi:hypothetical protein GQ457_08G031870 [Hibiscus cannabinus]